MIAALAPRNAPGFDILATRSGRTAKIRVKTKSHEYAVWQWTAKKDGSIFRYLSPDSDFSILVDLADNRAQLSFFVVPTSQVDEWIRADFEEWLATPGRGGRPHDPSNKKRNLDLRRHQEDLEPYREDWELLWSGAT